MNAYSLDFREAVLRYVDEGHSQREAAALFKITPRCISRWLKLREQGNLQAVPVPRSPHKLFLEPLKEYIDKHPDSALAEIAKHFNCGINAVFKALRKLGYTYKKNNKSIKKRDESARAIFIERIKDEANENLVYVDESGIDTENVHECQ